MVDYTVEDLARAAGVPVSTIRMYQQRKLLDPPERRGRQAIYQPAHLERLQLIAGLQQRGYSLAAIADLIARLGASDTIGSLLHISADADDTLTLTAVELADRFAGTDLQPADIQRAAALGLVALDDNAMLTVSASFLHAGSTLARLGVPVAEILDEYETLRAHATQIAGRFTALFERHFWSPTLDTNPATGEDAVGVLQQLGPLALNITDGILRAALTDAAVTFADQHTGTTTDPPQPAPPHQHTPHN